MGAILKDGRVLGMRIAAPAGGLVKAAWTFGAREPKGSLTGVDSWTWENTFESYEGVPITPVGSVALGAAAQPATNVIIDLTNRYATVMEEWVVGSYYPDDFVLQEQTLTVQWTYKWKNPDLYKAVFYGDNRDVAGEIEWDPEVHLDSFELDLYTPGDATGMANLEIEGLRIGHHLAG
ncbi:MAG: hypothetical protein ACOC7N_03950 [Chloroflexota bacterium]